MKKEYDNKIRNLEDDLDKRLDDLINRKKAESEVLKKILDAFLKNEDGENENTMNNKKLKK